jgi:hypothetical protein
MKRRLSNSNSSRVSTRSVPLCLAAEWISFSSFFNLALHDPFFATACFGTATVRCRALPHSLGTTPRPSFPRLNLHNDRVRRNHGRLPSSRCIESARKHRAPTCALPLRASDTTLGLPGTNLLDEWIGDLPLIAELVASQLAKITCLTGRQYIENRFQRQSASPGP